MTTKTQASQEIRSGITRRAAQLLIYLLIQITLLLAAAGRVDWIGAWMYIGLYVLVLIVNAVLMARYHPELAAERATIAENVKTWDRWIITLITLLTALFMPLVAGLDVRANGDVTSTLLPALVISVLGYVLTGWAMHSNRFFSGMVRIQQERGHTAVSSGPYRIMRHPGYVGMILFTLAAPYLLGSRWALIPAGLTALLFVVRTALEDRTLRRELPGYAQYANTVRYRLLPGVW